MSLLRLDEENISHSLHHAVDILMGGGIVAYPTETFYGLGVKFDREDSLEKLHNIKQRPRDKALPIIIGSRELLVHLVSSTNDKAVCLMKKFWPGPLTLIVPAKEDLSVFITGDTHTVAVRIPGASFALRLAEYSGFPITATSANISGKPPAQDAETVDKYFGDTIDLIIDGGPTKGTLPTTIVDVTGDNINIVREGTIKRTVLLHALDDRIQQ
jgi:L-threonylcarbamoyladenylate synthase